MDDSAQRAAGEGYWRLEDIDSDHKTWGYHMDPILPLVKSRSAAAL